MAVLKRFFSRWQNWLGLFIVTVFVLMAIFAPLLSPKDPDGRPPLVQSHLRIPQPPGPGAPLGTLPDQSSIYDALVWGTRDALKFGVGVTAIIFFIGIFVGTLAAFLGGRTNSLLMGTTDAFLAFPVIAGVVFFTQLRMIMLSNLLLETDFANFSLDSIQGIGILETLFLQLNPLFKAQSSRGRICLIFMGAIRAGHECVGHAPETRGVCFSGKGFRGQKLPCHAAASDPQRDCTGAGHGCYGCRSFGGTPNHVCLYWLGRFDPLGICIACGAGLDLLAQGDH